MKNTSNGKFCDRCRKSVIDLDKHSAPNVKEFCGKKTITTQTIILNYPKILQNVFFKRVVVFLMAILLFRKMEAQDTIHTKNSERIKSLPKSKGTEKETKISGVVIDKGNKEPMPFANIMVQDELGKKIAVAQTDLEGKFNLKFQVDSVNTKTFSIKVTYVGYTTVMINKIPKDKFNFEVELKPEMNAKSVTTGIYISSPDDFYPDPFSSGKKYTGEQIKNRAK